MFIFFLGEYIFEQINLIIHEIKDTEHREINGRVSSFRKIRSGDNHRSNIFITLWGRQCEVPENLLLQRGDWISMRNFKGKFNILTKYLSIFF